MNVRGRASAGPGTASRPLRIVWFGSYAKGPGYPRSETLIEGLRSLGHEVHEVHAPLFAGAGERVQAGRGGGLLRSGWRQLRAALRLTRGWFRVGTHDVVVVGAGGVVDAPLLRFLQNFDRRPIVLDAFIPLYDTVVRDRGLAAPGSLRARSLLAFERLSGRVSDLTLADTEAHAELLATDLRLSPDRLAVIPVAQRDGGVPEPLPEGGSLQVLLVSTYIPLHGVATVLEAARALPADEVSITLVGTGQGFEAVRERATGIEALQLVPRFLPEDEIRARLAASHVGLGIFGGTAKAGRVVPLKAALTLAAGRALVTRDSTAARAALGPEGDHPAAALLVPPEDPGALARALLELARDRTLLDGLAAEGRRRYLERFTPERVATALVDALAAAGLDPRQRQR